MKFQCATDDRLDGMDLCYKADHLQENQGIVHLKECPSGQMCHGKLNRCMADPYNMFEGKLPGQSCKHNYQCASGACEVADEAQEKFVCSGMRLGDSCSMDNDCGTGLFCDTARFQCIPLKGLNSQCLRDEECSNSMACSNKQCIPYGTLEDFEQSDNALACRSGFTNDSKCVPSPQIVNKQGPDYRCESPLDTCHYQIPSTSLTFETPCSCGLTPTGASFCPNIYTPTYTTLLRDVTERFSQSCHTSDRANIYECLLPEAQKLGETGVLNEFIIQHFERISNNQVRDNDQCMKKHSQVSQYWDAKANRTIELRATTMQTSASIAKKPSFIVLILCFLAMILMSHR
ncbi:hypothetical protein FGO68_gene3615 [Halteria grandinella]|uniref:Dickkopf N-terminal cysteine-rich domain-containing protein n=1 Tax=Halteria grandinella TaxID=5974 RepID=A0A8J8NQI0_HALGN|nr:hypothetical protein FGO68_gene3615 [Halteria grandinella]